MKSKTNSIATLTRTPNHEHLSSYLTTMLLALALGLTSLLTLSIAQSARAASDWLCFSNTNQSKQQTPLGGSTNLTGGSRNLRHALAARASTLVYQLSDLEGSKTGADLIKGHEEFKRAIPAGYEVMHSMSNRMSGLKYMILSPVDPRAPWIFAFAGTESTLDWMANLNLGQAQLEQVEGLSHLFTDCEYTDPMGLPMSARQWIITGHSLGGGLAQAFAYQVQKKRLLMGLSAASLELVTFNGFGALDLVESKIEFTYPVMETIPTSNYFITGDPVSIIGQHLGTTYEMKMPVPWKIDVKERIKRHLMDDVMAWVMKSGSPRFDHAIAIAPPKSGLLNELKTYGVYVSFLPHMLSDRLEAQFAHAKVLQEATAILENRLEGKSLSKPSPLDFEAVTYVSNLVLVFLQDQESRPSGVMRDLLIRDLNKIMDRLVLLK